MSKRLLEILAMLLIGDGLLTVLDPKRHCLLWEVGPSVCRDAVAAFAQRPDLARYAGLAETLLGVALAQSQQPRLLERLRARV